MLPKCRAADYPVTVGQPMLHGHEKSLVGRRPGEAPNPTIARRMEKALLPAVRQEPAETTNQKLGAVPMGLADHVGNLVVGGQRARRQRGQALDVSVIWHVLHSYSADRFQKMLTKTFRIFQ
jgi:hypothetical protein